jgi:hypothetical protein
MTDKTHDLQQLISMSRTMLEKAREESWDKVNVLEAERSELIRKFFSEPVQHDYAEMIADGVQLIIAINRDIIELGALSRLNLAHTLQNMDQGKKAIKAYAS